MQGEEQKPIEAGFPVKAVEGLRAEFQHQLQAAKARRQLRQNDDAAQSKGHVGYQPERNTKSWCLAVAIGIIAVAACVLIFAFGILRWYPQTSAVAMSGSGSLTLWHDGNDWEQRQLVEFGQVFGQIKGISVVIEVKTDLWGELIRAVVLQKPPDLAIVSEELAHRLLVAQALTAFNKAHITTDGTVHSDAYFGYLAPPKPWTRSQVLVVPRTKQPSELALQFAEFLMQSI